MAKKVDLRVQRTKKAILETFFALLEEKHFSEQEVSVELENEEKEQKSQANNSVKDDKTVEQMKIKDEQKNLNPTK